MAWISVHEKIIGGKLRKLAKEIGCSQNEALGILVRFWLWGINNADKEGMIVGADKEDIVEILTVGIDKKYSSYKVVEALISTNWLDIGCDSKLYIHDWHDWQEQWYKAVEIREKDAARKREERKRKRIKNIKVSSSDVENQAEKNPKFQEISKNEPKMFIESTYTKDFEEFWEMYPRKVGKGEAYKKYQARLKDGWSPLELMEAARNYASVCMNKKTEKEYIKHAKTFLSDSTPFIDYLPRKEETLPDDDSDYFKEWGD